MEREKPRTNEEIYEDWKEFIKNRKAKMKSKS